MSCPNKMIGSHGVEMQYRGFGPVLAFGSQFCLGAVPGLVTFQSLDRLVGESSSPSVRHFRMTPEPPLLKLTGSDVGRIYSAKWVSQSVPLGNLVTPSHAHSSSSRMLYSSRAALSASQN